MANSFLLRYYVAYKEAFLLRYSLSEEAKFVMVKVVGNLVVETLFS